MRIFEHPYLSIGVKPNREEMARVLARGQQMRFNYRYLALPSYAFAAAAPWRPARSDSLSMTCRFFSIVFLLWGSPCDWRARRHARMKMWLCTKQQSRAFR